MAVATVEAIRSISISVFASIVAICLCVSCNTRTKIDTADLKILSEHCDKIGQKILIVPGKISCTDKAS